MCRNSVRAGMTMMPPPRPRIDPRRPATMEMAKSDGGEDQWRHAGRV